MATRVGTGYIDVFGKLNQSQLASEVRAKMGLAGKEGSAAFSKSFAGGIKSAFSQLKGLGIGGLGGVGVLGGALFGAAGAGAVLAGLKSVADDTANLAGEIRGLRATTGDTAEDSSRLVAILHDLGIESSTAQRPFLRLAQSIGQGGGKLKEFFGTEDIARFKNQELSKTILEIGDRYKAIQNPIERDNLLIAAFGARGAALRPILSASREELEKFAEAAGRQGLIFTDEQLAQAREYQIRIRELGETFEGLKVQIGRAVVPVLTALASGINDVILGTEGAVRGLQGAGDSFADTVVDFVRRGFGDKVADFFAQGLSDQTGSIISNARRLKDEAAPDVESFKKTLAGIEATASEDEEAAKKLGEAIKQAFDISDKAAQAFDKRLAELIPAFGEEFKDIDFGLGDKFERDADKIEAASERVHDAQKRVADSLDAVREADARRDKSLDLDDNDVLAVAKATDAYQEAMHDLAKAQEELNEAQKGTLVPGLEANLTKRTSQLNTFADDIERIRTRLAKVGVRGDLAESLLGNLVDLGPGADKLLGELVNASDSRLKGLSKVFSDNVAAAKRAADLQFDKYPANFAEKLAAARDAAIDQLDDLVQEFQALPDSVDPGGAWAQKMDDMALAIQVMAQQGQIGLTPVQQGFLDTALTADDVTDKVRALQRLIDSLHGKSIDIQINTILQQDPTALGLPFSPGFVVPPELAGARASGGPVRRGSMYRINEAGAEVYENKRGEQYLMPDSDGHVWPAAAAGVGTGGTMTIEVPVYLDGREIARASAPHVGRELRRSRRRR